MIPSENKKAWDLLFTVEVAATYHDWRRATLGTCVTIVRAVALLGAIVSFVAINVSDHVALLISVISAVVGGVTLIDLVFGFDPLARKHDELFRRCKELQAKILSKYGDQSELEGEAQRIWRDEPPTYWAIYAMCWNQIASKYQSDVQYKAKVGWIRRNLGLFMQFAPQDFQSAAGSH